MRLTDEVKMENDNKIKDVVAKIRDKASAYINYVDALNPCAYSDRIIEELIDESKKLENYVNKQFRT